MIKDIVTGETAEFLIRVLWAGICGIIVGIERQRRTKNAGVRTHFMVAMSTALMMVVSKYGFLDVALENGMNVDVSRVAASIIGGVGILGGGLICMGKQGHASGITTTTGVLMTMAIGMAIGAGMYALGTLSTVLVVGGQIILHLNIGLVSEQIRAIISVRVSGNREEAVLSRIKKEGIAVNSVKWRHLKNDEYEVTYKVIFPKNMGREQAKEFVFGCGKIESFEITG